MWNKTRTYTELHEEHQSPQQQNPLTVYQPNFANPTYVLLTLLDLPQLLPANGLEDKNMGPVGDLEKNN